VPKTKTKPETAVSKNGEVPARFIMHERSGMVHRDDCKLVKDKSQFVPVNTVIMSKLYKLLTADEEWPPPSYIKLCTRCNPNGK